MRSPKLHRNTSNAKIAGVAAGIADHFGIDPTLVRAVFVVLAVCGGTGLLLYAALWIVVPKPPPAPPASDAPAAQPELSHTS
jgi:phage shock protein PspC (stress-responsive transcriptional regulator)